MRNGSRVRRWGRLFVLSSIDHYSVGLKLHGRDVVFLSITKIMKEPVRKPQVSILDRNNMCRFLDQEKLPETH